METKWILTDVFDRTAACQVDSQAWLPFGLSASIGTNLARPWGLIHTSGGGTGGLFDFGRSRK